jgi:NAD(P)-dependent dehydrogenase (short-subunit alcohol dehydrogenase family)
MPDQATPQPPQHQDRQPGLTAPMDPPPRDHAEGYRGAARLEGKVALITGGDSGIGRATAICFAKEGADIAILYLDEHEDAEATRRLVAAAGGRCIAIPGDIGDESICRKAVEKTVATFGRLDVLVNNAGEQHPQEALEEISTEQLERTFQTNVFGMFHITKAALAHLGEGAAIVNCASVTAYRGNPLLIDYSATKGAIVAFTRALAESLKKKKIRVNAVAPGPVWTPLIPASFDADKVASFGAGTFMERPAHADEIAPSFVFLASADAACMTGQVLHPNGGDIVGG